MRPPRAPWHASVLDALNNALADAYMLVSPAVCGPLYWAKPEQELTFETAKP